MYALSLMYALTTEPFIKLKGYKVFHNFYPENAAKRGSSVVIKEALQHYQEIKYKSEPFQAASVEVKTKINELSLDYMSA